MHIYFAIQKCFGVVVEILNFEVQIPINTQHMLVIELKCSISHLVFVYIDQFYAKLDAIGTHSSEFCNPQNISIFKFFLCQQGIGRGGDFYKGAITDKNRIKSIALEQI